MIGASARIGIFVEDGEDHSSSAPGSCVCYGRELFIIIKQRKPSAMLTIIRQRLMLANGELLPDLLNVSDVGRCRPEWPSVCPVRRGGGRAPRRHARLGS